MNLAALVNSQGPFSQQHAVRPCRTTRPEKSTSGSLILGNARGATFARGSGVYSRADSNYGTAGAMKYGDSNVSWSRRPQAESYFWRAGTAASAGRNNVSITSTKSITRLPAPLLPGFGNTNNSNVVIGPDLASMDLRSLTMNDGGRISGIRNGTEAFAVVGESRAYKNGNEVLLICRGTGTAGVTGNTVWVRDTVNGYAWASLCDCTRQRLGMSCRCNCHGGHQRKH